MYEAYWRALRDTIESVPIKGAQSIEDLEGWPLSFNVPNLGQFYFNMKKEDAIKKKIDDKIKKSQTDVHSSDNHG